MPARDDPRMHRDHEAQPRLGILDLHRRLRDFAVELIEPVLHDVEQQLGLAMDVVIEPGLSNAQGLRDVADRCCVIALLQNDLGGLPIDLRCTSLALECVPVLNRHSGVIDLPTDR